MDAHPRRDTPAAQTPLIRISLVIGLLIALLLGMAGPAGAQNRSVARVGAHATKVSATKAHLAWSLAPGVRRFKVVYSARASLKRAKHVSVRGHSVTLGHLRPGTTYFVKVKIAQRRDARRTPGVKSVRYSFHTPGEGRGRGSSGAPGTWLSGMSGGSSATYPQLASWRGRAMGIAGTWNDSFEGQTQQYSIASGGWGQGNVDDAIGAIWKDRGETWSAAGRGAYDARWSQALTKIRNTYAAKSGTVYIRFAHEFNGTWYGWSVKPSETTDFKAAWRRFYALKQKIFPQAKLVFCTNSDNLMGTDWRNAWPGKQYVDVYSTDFYNQYPFLNSQSEFDNFLNATAGGSPRGLDAHRKFAESQGLPFAISEWSSNGSMGDSPAFISALHGWLKQHGGRGAGRVLYEIEFNCDGTNDNNFTLYPVRKQPRASAVYRSLWSRG